MTHINLVSGNLKSLAPFIEKLGFQLYGSFNEDTDQDEVDIQHETYTCTRGKYNGDVIDVYYDYNTGKIFHKEICSQFRGVAPVLSF